ncbi:MAG: hypothetical protein ACREJ5_22565 [Geminicoccaceae bacterium]
MAVDGPKCALSIRVAEQPRSSTTITQNGTSQSLGKTVFDMLARDLIDPWDRRRPCPATERMA